MTRGIFTAVAIAVGMLGSLGSGRAADRKPNFVFVYADDHRWDAVGAVQKEQGESARYPWFQSPNLDRVAAGGVRFRNAFVTLSLCSPSRAAFLTGRCNHANGITNNSSMPFPEDAVRHATPAPGRGRSSKSRLLFCSGPKSRRDGLRILAENRHRYNLGQISSVCDPECLDPRGQRRGFSTQQFRRPAGSGDLALRLRQRRADVVRFQLPQFGVGQHSTRRGCPRG